MSFRSWILPAILAAALCAPRPAPAQNDFPRGCAACGLSAREAASPALLDINSAGVEQLVRLPGIGPARAALIVRIRERNGPFRSVDELRALPRFSGKLFAQLRERVMVVPRRDEVESAPRETDLQSSQPELR